MSNFKPRHARKELISMKANPVRVLCVDSSDSRREQLTAALENGGVEVWAARDLRDALPLVDGLLPDAILVDQASTHQRHSEWKKLIDRDLKVPALVHSTPSKPEAWPDLPGDFGVVRTQDPEVIVAILTLLLGPQNGSAPSVQTRYVA
jgi:PleD family two-component response regulator